MIIEFGFVCVGVCVCVCVCVCNEQFHCHFLLGIYTKTIGASFGFVLIHYRHYWYFQIRKDIVHFEISQKVCKVQEFNMSIQKLHLPPIWCVCKDTKQEIKSGSYAV